MQSPIHQEFKMSSTPPAPGAEGCASASQHKQAPPLSFSNPRWASLPEDLLRLVASRLLAAAGDLLDYVRFRGRLPRLAVRHGLPAWPRGDG